MGPIQNYEELQVEYDGLQKRLVATRQGLNIVEVQAASFGPLYIPPPLQIDLEKRREAVEELKNRLYECKLNLIAFSHSTDVSREMKKLYEENADVLGKPINLDKETGQLTRYQRLEKPHTEGYFRQFEKGSIFWCKKGGIKVVIGTIWEYYLQHDGFTTFLGFPVSAQFPADGSRYGTEGYFQRFESTWDYLENIDIPPGVRCGGTVYVSKHGAYKTRAGIGSYYESKGGTTGSLGFPTSDERGIKLPLGRTEAAYQRFEGGVVFWRGDNNSVYELSGASLALYEELGGIEGKLGFPKSSGESLVTGAKIQKFEYGIIFEVNKTAISLKGEITGEIIGFKVGRDSGEEE